VFMTLLLIRRSVDDGPREGGRPISQLRTESNGGENDSGVFEIPRHALLGQEGSAANAARGEVTLGKPLKAAALGTPARAIFDGAAPLTQGGVTLG